MNRDDNLCWYHGCLSRDDADRILLEAGAKDGKKDGVFLVRDSSTSPGDYVLSVLHQGIVCHYQIRRHKDDALFSIEDDQLIHGLDALIEHYQRPPNGLATQLSAIVKCDLPPVDSRCQGRENLLHRATKEKSVRVVSELLQANTTINIDAKNQDGQAAVHLASLLDEHSDEILQRLIEKGANVNCRDKDGNTPLHYACRRQSAAVIRLLVDAKANMIARNIESGRVPLHDAADHGNLEAVKQLLELDAPQYPRTKSGETPVQFAQENEHQHIVDFLEQYKPPEPKTSEAQWYHGTLSRQEAQNILKTHDTYMRERRNSGNLAQADINSSFEDGDDEISGLFLVRFSERESSLVLTLLDNDSARNFIIRRHNKMFYIDEGPFMRSLEHLIEHYMRFSDGLPINLRHPVKPQPRPRVPDYRTIPKPKKEQKSSAFLSEIGKRNSAESSPLRSAAFLPDDHLGGKAGPSNVLAGTNKNGNITENSNGADKTNSMKKSPGKMLISSFWKKSNDSFNKASDVNENTLSPASSILSQSPVTFKFRPDDLYNVPPKHGGDDAKNQNNLGSTTALDQPQCDALPNNLAAAETDRFTQSDKAAPLDPVDLSPADDDDHDKDNAIEEIYFVEAPTKMVSATSLNYISMKQSPYFPNADDRSAAETDNEPPAYIAPGADGARADRTQSISDGELLAELQISTAANNRNNNHSGALAQAPAQNYYIPKASIELESVLGRGEFGSVHRGFVRCESPNENGNSETFPVAIKTLHDEHCKENRIEFLREASVMLKLSHYCIVRLIGISKGPPLMIIQELVPLGSLHTYLIEHSDEIKPNVELKIWASQIASGMHYLETQHFVHRDLAARNILLASIHQAKISDFGLSRALCANNNYYQASHGGKWPIKWYAPESYNFGTFSHASDVWSFGVTLWEMYSYGKAPYGEMRGVDVTQIIEKGERLQQPELCPDNVFKIICSCWNYKPKQRPTFRYLADFFSNDPEYQNLVEVFKDQYEN